MSNERGELFAVFAEVEGFDKPLIMTDLTFARLIDDVVVPFEDDKPLFIDGAPVNKKKIRRLKILRQKASFHHSMALLHRRLSHGDKATQKTYGEQYHTRFEAALRDGNEDITSQVIKAFDQKIRPNLKEYLPKRKELIEAAYQVLIFGLKTLAESK
jgi:hypothetical protein